MSSEESKSEPQDEQITKVPTALTSVKVKDPKKVAAGKKLAESNKRAREAQAREEKRETKAKSGDEEVGANWLPEVSFSNFLTMVGIRLTVFQLFQTHKEKYVSNTSFQESEPLRLAQLPPPPQPVRPIMGMD